MQNTGEEKKRHLNYMTVEGIVGLSQKHIVYSCKTHRLLSCYFPISIPRGKGREIILVCDEVRVTIFFFFK
jgi:hypothetical protein